MQEKLEKAVNKPRSQRWGHDGGRQKSWRWRGERAQKEHKDTHMAYIHQETQRVQIYM